MTTDPLFPHLGKSLVVISSLSSNGFDIELLENAWLIISKRLLEEAKKGKNNLVLKWAEIGL